MELTKAESTSYALRHSLTTLVLCFIVLGVLNAMSVLLHLFLAPENLAIRIRLAVHWRQHSPTLAATRIKSLH